MAYSGKPRSEGVNVSSDLPPSVLIVTKKTTVKNHIVVGSDAAQVRFLETYLGLRAVEVERVTDSMLAGNEGLLFHVSAKYKIDLSPEIQGRTGRWAADPITKGSAAINAIVRLAATLLPDGEKNMKRETLDAVGDVIAKGRINDIYATLWACVWMLSGPIQEKVIWSDPWESPVGWLPIGVDPSFRLHTLYHKLVSYTTYLLSGEEVAKKLDTKPTHIQRFKQLNLNNNKVYRTLSLLSTWRHGQMDPFICAMRVSSVWAAK